MSDLYMLQIKILAEGRNNFRMTIQIESSQDWVLNKILHLNSPTKFSSCDKLLLKKTYFAIP